MLFRRFGRPSLLGLAAGTAVVAGTASAVDGAMAGRRERIAAERALAEQPPAPPVQPPAPAAAAPPGPGKGTDLMSELERLGSLRQQGLLDDAEFTAAKQRLITG